MPRRGVVVSDDEDSTPSSRQPRQSASRSGSRREVLRPSAATDAEVPSLPSVAKLSPEEVQQLGLLSSDRRNLRQHIIAAMAVISDAAVAVEELKASAENSRTVETLETTLRAMVDESEHLEHTASAVEATSRASANSQEPVALHEIYTNDVQKRDTQYTAKSAKEKYGRASEWLDFKRRVWDIKHENQPPPEDWFENRTADDDIVVDQEIQSLKCPITLTLLEKPVRNTTCPHVYSLEAIKELVRQGRGSCTCPVAGCQVKVSMNSVKEDKAMERKVREERAREEERALDRSRDVQELTEGMSEVIYEDDDVKVEG